MAEKKITDLGTLDAIPAGGDYVPVVDVSDSAQSAAGSTKKITITRLQESLATSSHLQAITAGGTGEITAQASIDALTQVSGGTEDHVLTKDSSGNAVWAAAPGASGGEANTASNVTSGSGTEVGVFKAKNIADLEFKSLKEGTNVTLTSNANDVTISAAGTTYSAATSSTLGLVKIEDDTEQSVTAEAVSATASRTYGIQLNSSDQAVVNIPWTDTDTNTDTKWDGGTTDLVAATGRTSLGLAIGTDVMAHAANNAVTSAVQSFSVAQRGSVITLYTNTTPTPDEIVSGSTGGSTLDFALGNNYEITLSSTAKLINPTNLTAGQSGAIVLTQDGSGSRLLTYSSYWKFIGGSIPTLTTTAAAVDVLVYYVESATRIAAKVLLDVK